MPYKSKRPCAFPGCTSLVSGGYCAKHQRAVPTTRSSEADKAKHRLYGRAWKKARAEQLEREPWCADCLRKGIHTFAVDVHHDERHEGDVEKFWRSKRTSLCHTCHSRRTADEVSARGRGGQNVLTERLSSVGEVSCVKNSPIETGLTKEPGAEGD